MGVIEKVGGKKDRKENIRQETDTSMLFATAASQARVAGPGLYKGCLSCFVVTTSLYRWSEKVLILLA